MSIMNRLPPLFHSPFPHPSPVELSLRLRLSLALNGWQTSLNLRIAWTRSFPMKVFPLHPPPTLPHPHVTHFYQHEYL